jgi:DNA modification methylase
MNNPASPARWVPIDTVTPWDQNPRINDAAVEHVAASIERFGWGSPIIARESDGVIIAGHTRLKAAKHLGMDKVLVRYLDLDPAQAAALALADNKLGEIADWDDAGVAAILKDLDTQSFDLSGLGWSEDELTSILASGEDLDFGNAGAEDLEDFMTEEAPDSVVGTVYELGPHLLLCGDSTRGDDWETLLQGRCVDAFWTDPPYGVAYVGKTEDALTIQNDNLDDEELAAFLGQIFDNMLDFGKKGAPLYVAAPAGPKGNAFAVELHKRSLFRQKLVWVKQSMVLGRSDYHYRHEDIYYGYVPGAQGRRGRFTSGEGLETGWFGDDCQTTVLEFDRPMASREHPTMKPLDLIVHCLKNSTAPGQTVMDPFGGSGSTLIAAASINRYARLIEKDPKYCDVIRRRWTRFAKEHNLTVGSGGLESSGDDHGTAS